MDNEKRLDGAKFDTRLLQDMQNHGGVMGQQSTIETAHLVSLCLLPTSAPFFNPPPQNASSADSNGTGAEQKLHFSSSTYSHIDESRLLKGKNQSITLGKNMHTQDMLKTLRTQHKELQGQCQ